MKIIFSENYTVDIDHKFRGAKFEETFRLLVKKRVIKADEALEPEMPEERDLLLAHTGKWVNKLLDMELSAEDAARSEMPVNKDVIFAHLLHTGGTIKAANLALETGLGIHCGGGAHHAHRDYGAGFCLINDIAVAVRKLLNEKKISRPLVADLDVHQGDGTAEIFRGEKNVFTFSMHQAGIYPEKKEKSSLDLELPAGTGGAEYLRLLKENLPGILEAFKPDFIIYNAGADVYKGDMLGGLKLGFGDIIARDRLVFELAKAKKIPLALVLSGGYAEKPADTVKIHFNTIRTAIETYKR